MSEKELAEDFIQEKEDWTVIHGYEEHRLPSSILPDDNNLSSQKNHLREVDLVMEDGDSNHWVIELKKRGKGANFDAVLGQALVSKHLYIKDKDIDPDSVKAAVVVKNTRSGRLLYGGDEIFGEGVDAQPKSDGDVPDRMLYEICVICRNYNIELYSKMHDNRSFIRLTNQNIMED